VNCYYCHKRIEGDYRELEKNGKILHVHPICAVKLEKCWKKREKEERERKKQTPLLLWTVD
jgi:hypothetical protein